jgi:apolipoprotein N-acyltransferase
MTKPLATCLLAAISGLLLFASDYPIGAWPLYFIALVPLFFGLQRAAECKVRVRYAAFFVASYCIPTLLFIGTALPVLVSVFVGAIQWLIIIVLLTYVGQRTSLWTCWLVAAIFCVGELVVWHTFPLFGTAQCFARVTSNAPFVVQFAAYVGLIGVVFVTVAIQYCIATLVKDLVGVPSDKASMPRWQASLTVLATLIAIIVFIDYMRWNRPLTGTVQASAIGWSSNHSVDSDEVFAWGAKDSVDVFVTPETGLFLHDQTVDDELREITSSVQATKAAAAIGAFRFDTDTNQSLLIDPNGTLNEVYEKSHLIPWMEDYNAGDYEISQVLWNDVKVGTMICQDDNFTDLSSRHSLAGTQLMLLPTNDWAPIRVFHFENSRMRAIEAGYAIVRGTSGGISAIVSARGELVSVLDHTIEGGIGSVSSTVVVGDGEPTMYSKYGDFLIGIPSVLICLLGLLIMLRSKSSTSLEQST